MNDATLAKELHKMEMFTGIEYRYTFGGTLKSGFPYYVGKDGSYAVERDYLKLTDPTAEEMKEIEGMKGDGK